jgi:hypothetical protein
MPRKETLYERPLRRPLDEPTRRAIESEYRRRRHEIPIPTELRWHPSDPRFTIHSSMLSFVVHFTIDNRLVVDAELSMAARMLATVANRRQAVQFIESIAVGLGL